MQFTKSRFFLIVLFSICLVIIYYLNVTDILSLHVPRQQVRVLSRERRLCVEDNICRENADSDVYIYKRKPDFYQLIDKVDLKKNGVNITQVVPNVVHYTWYGGLRKGNNFRFHHMLAILSAHKFIQPDRIYFWHDMVPTGEYWTELKSKVPELCLVYRKTPTEIRGRVVNVPEHQTDVVRLEAVLEFGGMYFDLDVMVLKSLEPLLKYDVTMGYETPGGLCNGIIIGRAWADFFKVWHKEYKSFQDSHWNYHSVQLPHVIAKRHPSLIHTEQNSMHRPNWMETNMLYGVGKLYDWRNKNYCSHLWIRFHKIEHNAQDIKTWNTTVGEMWRWIYYGDWRLQLPTTVPPKSPAILPPQPNLCILGNLCRTDGASKVYNYKRGEDFLTKVDADGSVSKEKVPNIVHVTWYGRAKGDNSFKFNHLISLLSSHKFLKPDRILFWHDNIPEGKFWNEVKVKVPELSLVYRPALTSVRGRTVPPEHQVHLIGMESVLEYGGVFHDLDVVFLKGIDPLLKHDVIMGYQSGTDLSDGIIIGKPWADFLKFWHRDFKSAYWTSLPGSVAKKHSNVIHIENNTMHRPNSQELDLLYSVGKLYNWRDNNYAINLWSSEHKVEHSPVDINYLNTTVGEIFRFVYYGESKLMEVTETKGKICIYGNICKDKESDIVWKYIRLPTFMTLLDTEANLKTNITHDTSIVPNIVHFTWYGGSTSKKRGNVFRFHHMLSVLSAHKFIKPERVLFWHDLVPEGPYWEEIREKVPELIPVFREAPMEIRGKKVAVGEHLTDVVRLEAVVEYGGMYFDLDAMVVKPLTSLLKYDVTMGYETPEGLCNGIIIGKPWADFLKIWHNEYKTFDDSNWAYHSVLLPAALAKRYPSLIHTEANSLHKPNWTQVSKLYDVGNLYDWRSNNYAVHLWIRFHKTEHNATDIKTWNTTAGEIFRHIYYDDWRIKP